MNKSELKKKFGPKLGALLNDYPVLGDMLEELVVSDSEFTSPETKIKSMLYIISALEKLDNIEISRKKLALKEEEQKELRDGGENIFLKLKQLAAK